MLRSIDLPSEIDSIPVPQQTEQGIRLLEQRIQAFQDCWAQSHAEQFVAADYFLVYQTLQWLAKAQPMIGSRFLEWGCGFAAVACLADSLNWNSHAIESHPDLVQQAKQTIQQWSANGQEPARVQLFAGNFLPPGAEHLADDPTLPSLYHEGKNPYHAWDLELDDFALVYSYPWPGEDEFHAAVFDRYAAPGAMLLMFLGPNHMQLSRKVND
ncbi:MAG: hypothetical protein CBB71_07080 [Rhodopirellula sp. TMED11]|nr:MAG: hypothetical protein CBB71_07080 [Rhodopirellula sp. TMED11]